MILDCGHRANAFSPYCHSTWESNFPYQASRNQRKKKGCDWKISCIRLRWSITEIYLPDGQECMLVRALFLLFSIWKGLNSAGFTSNLFLLVASMPTWHTLRLKDNIKNDWGEALMKHLWLMPSLLSISSSLWKNLFFPIQKLYSVSYGDF